MAYLPRRILPNHLYEITVRTFQARYFFVPKKEVSQYIAGAVAYAQAKYEVEICANSWMSNHAHYLIVAQSALQLSHFLKLVNEQVAKEVQRFCKKHGIDWTGGVFAKRPHIAPVEGGAKIQRARLKYLLSQGVKEGLVSHPTHWYGVNSAKALLSGSMKIEGIWVNRSELYEVERGSRRRKKKVTRKRLRRKELAKHQAKLTVKLSPMPYQRQMSEAERREDIRQIIYEILEENKEMVAMAQRYRKQCKRRIMDVRNLAKKPKAAKNDVAPLVHADGFDDADDHTWRMWMLEWESWLNAYERASRRWRKGIKEALGEFPEGCFIPCVPIATLTSRPPP